MKYDFLALLATFIASLVCKSSFAKNKTYQEVLKNLYPECELQKKVHYLTQDQIKNIELKTKKKLYSKIRIQYIDPCSNDNIYVDSHIVRTLNETVLIALNKKEVKHIKIASFMEPREYLPPKKWIEQLKTKKNEEIDSLSGATLSENALKRSLNEIKVLHEVIKKQNL